MQHSDRERCADASQCQPARHHILNKNDQSAPPSAITNTMEYATLCKTDLPLGPRKQWTHGRSKTKIPPLTRYSESARNHVLGLSVLTKSKGSTIAILLSHQLCPFVPLLYTRATPQPCSMHSGRLNTKHHTHASSRSKLAEPAKPTIPKQEEEEEKKKKALHPPKRIHVSPTHEQSKRHQQDKAAKPTPHRTTPSPEVHRDENFNPQPLSRCQNLPNAPHHRPNRARRNRQNSPRLSPHNALPVLAYRSPTRRPRHVLLADTLLGTHVPVSHDHELGASVLRQM